MSFINRNKSDLENLSFVFGLERKPGETDIKLLWRVNGFIKDSTGLQFHYEIIVCPECNRAQIAMVEYSTPFNIYIHDCERCNYIIMESEWNNLLSENIE